MVVKLPPGLPPSFSVCRDVRSKRQISPPPPTKGGVLVLAHGDRDIG